MEDELNTQVENLEGKKKISVTVEAAEVTSAFAKKYKEFAKQYRFPGFRPGKAPRPVIDSTMGKDYVRSQVTDDLVNEYLPLGIDAADAYVMGDLNKVLEFDEISALATDKEDFSFTFTVPVIPELELSDYGPVEYEIPFSTASDEEVDKQIEVMMQYYMETEDADDDAAIEERGAAELAMTVTNQDGEEVSSMSSESRNYDLSLGDTSLNMFPKALDEALVGKKKGDEVELTLTVADNPCYMFNLESDSGLTEATFKVKVLQVKKKIMPELTDEWVSENMGEESVEAYRKGIAAQIEAEKARAIPQIAESNTMSIMAQRLQGDVPEELVREASDNIYQSMFRQATAPFAGRKDIDQFQAFQYFLQMQGMTLEQFREQVRIQAPVQARVALAQDAYARHEGLTVSDDEVKAWLGQYGDQNIDEMFEQWRANGELPRLRREILRTKAWDAIADAAIATEVSEPTPQRFDLTEAVEAASEAVEAAKVAAEEAKAEEVKAEIAEVAEEAVEIAEEAEAAAEEAAEEEAVEEAAEVEDDDDDDDDDDDEPVRGKHVKVESDEE